MTSRSRRYAAAVGLTLALSAAAISAGCQGEIGGDPDATACVGCDGPGGDAPLAASLRFPRLSHEQWENTVQDLFHLPSPTGFSASFTADTTAGSFDNEEDRLSVTPQLWADYEAAAEQVALMVTSDAQLLAGVLPTTTGDETAQAVAFIDAFGKRAFRRPLSDDEKAKLKALYDQGTMLGEGDTPFHKGLDLVIQAVLQSPFFVYRPELTEAADGDAIVLGPYELASRLSYMLTNTMPDDALFAAADAGMLVSEADIEAEARRLLATDRGHATINWFHRQLFQYPSYYDLYKDPMLFPDFDPTIGASFEKEADLFVDDIVSAGGGIAEILSSNSTFVDASLAKIYGLSGQFSDQFQRVALDPKQRSGFLTHAGFLASKATKREQDSIHRGVFIVRRVLCLPLGNPQPNVPPVPANSYPTNRERVDHHTGKGTCGAACHGTVINPSGFAFEHYDAVGQYQTTENGHDIDASGTLTLSSGDITYKDAVEFSNAIAKSDDVHACYSKNWLEYALGRRTIGDDAALLKDLSAAARKGTRELLVAITKSRAFRARAAAEVSQ